MERSKNDSADPVDGSLSPFSYIGPKPSQVPDDSSSAIEVQSARQNARKAVRHMLSLPEKSAVLLARDWQVFDGAYEFKDIKTYRQTAPRFGCFVKQVERDVAEGKEHLLFFTVSESTTRGACLASLEVSKDGQVSGDPLGVMNKGLP